MVRSFGTSKSVACETIVPVGSNMVGLIFKSFCLVALSLLVVGTTYAGDQIVDEHKLKAALIHKVAHYTSWKNSSKKIALCLCVDGNRSMYKDFQFLNGKKVKQREMVVKHLTDLDQLSACDILFISSSSNYGARKLLLRAHDKPILTIGETANFTVLGGIMRLYLKGQRTRFAISPNNANNAGIKISSRLLSVAKIED